MPSSFWEPLVTAATCAPSGDNTQPWRFEVDDQERRLEIHLDPTRDPSPMNADQRMARLGAGAALENLLRTAQHNVWQPELEPTSGTALAAVRLVPISTSAGTIEPLVTARVTNRRLYDGRPVGGEVLEQLALATPELHGVHTMWLTERSKRQALAALIGRADALMFGEPSMRRAFLANVRFDAPARAKVAEGLSFASLELGFADRLALRTIRRLPHWLVRRSGVPQVFAAHARRLVESASGLCLLTAGDSRDATDVVVGRALQRAWLALTALGLAVQPMMSMLVLANLLEHGRPECVASIGREQVEMLLGDFRRLVPEIGDGRPAFLLRFGYAPPPSGRTGRRDWQAVTAQMPAEGRGTLVPGGLVSHQS